MRTISPMGHRARNPKEPTVDTKTIQIAEIDVTVRTPYAAGHVINEHEARALNQTRAENIGNNFRKALAAAKKGEGSKTVEAILAEIAEYDANYVFSAGRATGSGSTMTPLEKMKLKLARNWLIAKLKAEKQITLKAYIEQVGEPQVDSILDQVMATEQIEKLAKEELKRQEKTAGALAEITV
jgi:hypothetical protein